MRVAFIFSDKRLTRFMQDADLFGNKVKDSITGFAGVAVAKTIWISGNVTIQIEATALEKSEPIDGHAFEYERVELVEESKPPMSAKSDPSKPGGPQKDPVQRNTVAIK